MVGFFSNRRSLDFQGCIFPLKTISRQFVSARCFGVLGSPLLRKGAPLKSQTTNLPFVDYS